MIKQKCQQFLRVNKDEKGQSLFEFLLLFGVIIGFSFVLLRVVNTSFADYWYVLGNKIIGPTDNPKDNPRVDVIRLK